MLTLSKSWVELRSQHAKKLKEDHTNVQEQKRLVIRMENGLHVQRSMMFRASMRHKKLLCQKDYGKKNWKKKLGGVDLSFQLEPPWEYLILEHIKKIKNWNFMR